MTHTQPKLIELQGGMFPKFQLAEDYRFLFDHGGSKAAIDVKAGYIYDGATLGSFLFWRKSMHREGATLVHDYGYEKQGRDVARYLDSLGRPNGPAFDLTKQELDGLWLRWARRVTNVQGWRDRIASGAFKSFAWFIWWGK